MTAAKSLFCKAACFRSVETTDIVEKMVCVYAYFQRDICHKFYQRIRKVKYFLANTI